MVALCVFFRKKKWEKWGRLGDPLSQKKWELNLLIFENTLTSDMPDCNSNSLRSARTCAAKQRKLHLLKNFCLYPSGKKTGRSWGKIAVLALGKRILNSSTTWIWFFQSICESCRKFDVSIWSQQKYTEKTHDPNSQSAEAEASLLSLCNSPLWSLQLHWGAPKKRSSFHQEAQILRANLSEHVFGNISLKHVEAISKRPLGTSTIRATNFSTWASWPKGLECF